MKDFIIEIRFEDNKEEKIEINLNRSTIIHGTNGSGKTRVLKAIHLLNNIVVENSNKKIFSLINDLNISSLKINNYDYTVIFEVQEQVRIAEGNSDKKFLKEHQMLIYEIIDGLENKLKNFGLMLTPLQIRSVERVINYGQRLEKYDYIRSSINREVNINRWIDDLRRVFQLFEKIVFRNRNSKELFHDEFQEIEYYRNDMRKIDYLINVYEHYNFEEQLKRERKYIQQQKITKEIKKLKKQLMSYTTTFIETTRLNFEYISRELVASIKRMNNKVIDNFWSGKSFLAISEEKIELYNKLEKLNLILKNYSIIQISLNDSQLCFEKNNEEILFEKLSSGERNIISLFTKIIFTNSKIVLIDEPEISLSLDYQSKIIFDLFHVIENRVLIIATHAPYIYSDFQQIDGISEVAINGGV